MINQLLNNNLSDYIIQIAQKPNAKEQLQLLLVSLFGSVQQEKQEEAFYEKPASSLVVFTKKDSVSYMEAWLESSKKPFR